MSKRLKKIAKIVLKNTGTDVSIDTLEAILRAIEQERYERVMRQSKLDDKLRKAGIRR